MKKVLITGASGFAGSHLAEYLISLGDYQIFGTSFSEQSIQKLPFKDNVSFFQLDLQDKDSIKKILSETKPDYVYHLAAMANVGESIHDPKTTFHNNIDSEINLFESLRELDLRDTRVLLVSSAEVYGYINPEDNPIDENTPHRPANPYAVSKIAQDYLGFQYHLSYKMPIVRVRPFNHVGPRQAPGFVVADFAKQIAEIEKGGEAVMKVGNLSAKRDFTDVRDMVRAYVLTLENGILGDVYNLGSGVSRSIQEVLDTLLSYSTTKIEVVKDESKIRPSDIPEIVCNNSKVAQLISWKAEIPFEKTLRDTLSYWRSI